MRSINIKGPFGLSVKTWRHRLGISQEELAERSGLHRTYICDVERGARNVSLESIEKLARALQVSVPSLLSYANGHDANFARILYVEDLQDDIELTLSALKNAHITNRVHVTHDGEAALKYIFGENHTPDSPLRACPDLILLDLGLPGINGLEVLRRVKNDHRTRKIPVVVLTASRRDRDLAASRQLGADACIIKPIDFQNLGEVTPKLSFEWALIKPPPGPVSGHIRI